MPIWMTEFMEIDVSNTLKAVTERKLSRRGFVALAGVSALPLAMTACGKEAGSKSYPTKTVRIMAPAATGGGWDMTARTIQDVLKKSKLVDQNVEVYNVDGAAGTNGLAEFVSKHQGDVHELMVMGLVMVGGIVANASPVTLSQITPLATLTAEQEVIVVPKDSKYETLADLMEAVKKDPKSVNWGGGSTGGTDHILVGLLAQAAGAETKTVAKEKYNGYSGGGESVAALLSGDLDVGVSGISEYAELVAKGDLRALAVSGAEAADTGDGETETIKDAGFDVELLNWRGIVLPPGISDGDRDSVVGLMDDLHDSKEWQDACKKNNWDDFYKTGQEAKSYFDEENARVTGVLEEIGLAG
jgi:putative tricarboxylic transport membrane protein